MPLIGVDGVREYICTMEQPPCSIENVIGAVCIDGPYGTEMLQYVYELSMWRYIFRSPLELDPETSTKWICAKIIYVQE